MPPTSPAAKQRARVSAARRRRHPSIRHLTDQDIGRVQGKVLGALSETGNLVEACACVRIHLPIVTGWMSASPDFRQLVERAKEEGRQHRVEELEVLLDKAAKRAPKSMHGVKAALGRLGALDARYRQRGPEITITGGLVMFQEIRAMPVPELQEFIGRMLAASRLPVGNGDAGAAAPALEPGATLPGTLEQPPCS